jgi:hypothetical protein
MKTYDINGVPTPISFKPSKRYLAERRAAERLPAPTQDDDEAKAVRLAEAVYPVKAWLADMEMQDGEDIRTFVHWTWQKLERGDLRRGRVRAITWSAGYRERGRWGAPDRWSELRELLTVVLPGADMKLDGPLDTTEQAPARDGGPWEASINGVPVRLARRFSSAAMAIIRNGDPFRVKHGHTYGLTDAVIATLPADARRA